MVQSFILVGAGTHAKMLLDILRLHGRKVAFAVDNDPARHEEVYYGVTIRGGDDLVLQEDPSQVRLINGVGSVARADCRRKLFTRFTERGYRFETLIHPSAVIAESARLGEGVQVMAGAVIQPDAVIEDNVLINTRASVDHDCRIGSHCHIAPGATLSGTVRIGPAGHVGTGSSVIQNTTIGSGAVIGAGAVVIDDLPDGVTAVGVPARIVKK